MTAGGGRCRRSTSRPGAASLCALAWPTRSGLPVVVDNDAKALALGEGWLGRPGAWTTTWPWWCRPGSVAASCSTVGCSTAPTGTPATSATWWSSPTAGACVCGGRGCLEAEASGLSIAAITGRPAVRGARARCAGGPGRWSAGRWPRWPICWTWSWRWWPVRSPSASAPRSSTPPKQEIELRSRLEFSRGTRIVPAGLGRGRARWSGRPRSVAGPWLGPRTVGGVRPMTGTPPGVTARRRRWRSGRAVLVAPRSVVDGARGSYAGWPPRAGGDARPIFPFPTPACGVSAWSPPTAGPMPTLTRTT